MNVLRRAAETLATRHRNATSVPVVYRSAAGRRVACTATVGRSEFESESIDGARMLHRTVDFLVTSAELTDDEGPLVPRAGDLVESDHAGVGGKYEVRSVGGAAVWEPSDAFGLTRRIHTQRVA